VLVAAGLVLAALAGGPPGRDGPPLDPRSDGPLGTSALVALLDGLGARVELSVGLPSVTDDVALLLQDRLDDQQAAELLAWVRSGRVLVVTDPGSLFAPPSSPGGLFESTRTFEPGDCTIDALAELGEVDAGAAVTFDIGDGATSCFDAGDGAFVAAREEGLGTLVAVGGAAFLTNELLDDADNAVLAAALLAPERGTTVRVVDAPIPAGGGDKGLADLVPDRVKRVLAQLGVAFVFYALWRAIRLGRPVPEPQPVAIAGSELVAAVGRLLARTRSPGAAADLLRADLRRALRTRLGVPPDADSEALAALVVRRTGLPPEQVRSALDERPVTTDAELEVVARAVSSIHQEVLR
jgi:hypothetical protein